MASTPTDLRPPWILPGRFAPLTIGTVLALVIVAAALAAQAVGAPTQYVRRPFEARVPWMFAGSTIWLYWMVAVHVRGVQRDFDALRPGLEAPERTSTTNGAGWLARVRRWRGARSRWRSSPRPPCRSSTRPGGRASPRATGTPSTS